MVDEVFVEGSGCECDVTLDTWLRDSLPTLPGALRSVASRELVLACREFFERSYAWVALIRDENAKAGDKQYWTSPYDEYSNVVAVLGVDWLGEPLTPLVTRPPTNPTTDNTQNRPLGYFVDPAPDAVYLYPELSEDVANALTFRVALTPKPTVEHLPRIAELKFYDAILDGFLARMYGHPNKPYSAPAMAQAKRRSFNHWIGRYMGQAKQGYVSGQNWNYPQGWAIRRFGGSRSA